jgi:hypothetical protein
LSGGHPRLRAALLRLGHIDIHRDILAVERFDKDVHPPLHSALLA